MSRRLKVDKELDERTFSDRVFQTHAAAIGKVRSPTVDRFDVGMANVSDDNETHALAKLAVGRLKCASAYIHAYNS